MKLQSVEILISRLFAFTI